MMTYLNPLRWGRWLGQLMHGWALSIPWRNAPRAIPALILLVVLAVTGVVAWSDGSDWRDRLLDNQLKAAWEIDDYDTAELIIHRKLAADPSNVEARFRLALNLEAQDKSEQATAMMMQLVELRNHEQAARWLLETRYLRQQWSDFSEQQKEEFGTLLEFSYQADDGDLRIKNLYADYLIAAAKYGKAVPVLDELSHVQPMRGLQAAAIARSLGDSTNAKLYAERCLKKVSEMAQEDPSNATLALALAQNQVFLKRFSDGVATLQRSLQYAKTDQDRYLLRHAFGDAIVAWIRYIESSPNESNVARRRVLKMLQIAVKDASDNPRVMALVADKVLATRGNNDQKVAEIRASILDALMDGESSGIAHFIEGTSALVDNDIDGATMHLKLAADMMPNSSAIMNNLAEALIARGDENLEEALKLCNTAIENSEHNPPHYYETRGQILLRMHRYLDAIPDLERALTNSALAPAAHKSLAACYSALGKDELSQMHLKAANADPPQREPGDTAESNG